MGRRRGTTTDEAVRQFRRLRKSDRALVAEGIRKHLAPTDPAQNSRNKFRLRRASPFAEFELRLDPWRVFYRLNEGRMEVTMIGEKRGKAVWIAGREFVL